jgi:hypothetical protein
MLGRMKAKIKELFGSEDFLVTVLLERALSCELGGIADDVEVTVKTPSRSASKIHLVLCRSRAFEKDAHGCFARTTSDLALHKVSIYFAESLHAWGLRNHREVG